MPHINNFNYFQELVGATTSERNWKGITIAIGVILLVLCGVAISVVILTPEDLGPRVKGTRFTINHILDHKLLPRRFNGSWISGTLDLSEILSVVFEQFYILLKHAPIRV